MNDRQGKRINIAVRSGRSFEIGIHLIVMGVDFMQIPVGIIGKIVNAFVFA